MARFVFNPQNPVPTAALDPWSRGVVRSTPRSLPGLGPGELCVGRRGLRVSLRLLRPGPAVCLRTGPGPRPAACSTPRYSRQELFRGYVRGGYLFFSVEGGPGRIL
jgi:hypothetical protein